MKEIYLDFAAATPPSARVLRAIASASGAYANPSSFNDAGRRAARVLAAARTRIARFLHARPDEVVLCSSGSEANALALQGITGAWKGRCEVLTADTEHRSVLETVAALSGRGVRRMTIPVDTQGCIDVDDVISRITPRTAVVSVMYANNEIGTIQPIVRIGQAIARWRRDHSTRYPAFHVDACQATTTLPMDVQRLGVDLLTLNGAKAYGPHGSALLYVRRGTPILPIIHGGSQEGGRRAGTEDVAYAAGLATALGEIRPGEAGRLARLRDLLIDGILRAAPGARLNGPRGAVRLAGNVNISVPGCDSENLLLELDRRGIRAGAGSACTAHRVEPSHVLVATGTPKRFLTGVLRFSLGRTTTRADIGTVIRVLPAVVARVRARAS